MARDAAFCFIYPANLDTLRALGAGLVFFSPLADEALPVCDAVWLPGGYPELHAGRLSRQHALRDSLRAHVAGYKPVWAECGGMMLLFDSLVTTDGTAHAMWGLLPGRVSMQKRLAGLGPQQLRLPDVQPHVEPDGQPDKKLDGEGAAPLRGHTFHYSTCETTLPAVARTARPETRAAMGLGEALYQLGPVRASYFHAWFASNPAATARLFLPAQEA